MPVLVPGAPPAPPPPTSGPIGTAPTPPDVPIATGVKPGKDSIIGTNEVDPCAGGDPIDLADADCDPMGIIGGGK